jgi:hypothetical protein
MASYSYEFFAGHVNETFSVAVGDSSVDMALVEAKRHKPRQVAGLRFEPFALYFRSQNQVILPQKIYSFRNPGLGQVDIFIVPIGREAGGIVYEAVFN